MTRPLIRDGQALGRPWRYVRLHFYGTPGGPWEYSRTLQNASLEDLCAVGVLATVELRRRRDPVLMRRKRRRSFESAVP